MSEPDDIPGWDGTMRHDGLCVAVSVEATWIVLPYDGRPPVTMCPCCGKPLANKLAAKRVADYVYPACGGSA